MRHITRKLSSYTDQCTLQHAEPRCATKDTPVQCWCLCHSQAYYTPGWQLRKLYLAKSPAGQTGMLVMMPVTDLSLNQIKTRSVSDVLLAHTPNHPLKNSPNMGIAWIQVLLPATGGQQCLPRVHDIFRGCPAAGTLPPGVLGPDSAENQVPPLAADSPLMQPATCSKPGNVQKLLQNADDCS